MQAKAEQAWEADKLAKRQARTPEVAVQSAFSSAMIVKVAGNVYAILVRYRSYFCFNIGESVFASHWPGIGVRWHRPST